MRAPLTTRSVARAAVAAPARPPERAFGATSGAGFELHRSSVPEASLQRACAACERTDETQLARRAASEDAIRPELAPELVDEVLGSGRGRALDASTRAYFEPRFRHTFAAVRVHDDARADASARSVRALAYTVGHQVVFRGGMFSPGTRAGRRLLAHELAHVVQQDGAVAARPLAHSLAVVPADHHSEREADHAAAAAVATSDAGPRGPAGAAVGGGLAPHVARLADGDEPAREPEEAAAAAGPSPRAMAGAVKELATGPSDQARGQPATNGRGGEVVHSTARSPEEDPEIARSRAAIPSNTVTCVAKWQPCRAPYSPGTWAARMTYHCPRLILPWGIVVPGTTQPAFATIPDEFIGTHPTTGRDMYRCRPRVSVTFGADVADSVAFALTRSMLFPGQAACHAGFRANLWAALEAMFVPSGGGRTAGIRVNQTAPGGGGIPFPCP